LKHHCSEKAAAESKVNEHRDVLSRMSAEISQMESMMTDKLRHTKADHEHAASTIQLTGNLSRYLSDSR